MPTRFARRQRTVSAAQIVACGLMLSCETPTDPPPDSDTLIQTDELSYPLNSDGPGLSTEIPYRFENRTGAPVYLVNCNGSFSLRLERWKGGSWQAAWAPMLSECLSRPIVIDADAIYSDTVRVWGARPGQNWYPQFDPPHPHGVYRLVWSAALSSFQDRLPFGELLPIEYRVSNPFVLTTN